MSGAPAETLLSRAGTGAGRLQRAVLAKIEQHRRDGTIPTNGRFLFYELEQEGQISKRSNRKRTTAQDLSDALIHLRRVGLVSWDEIVDETRHVTAWRFAATVYEYVVESIHRARINCWGGEPTPLIICESRATKGVLDAVAYEYLVPITATNGQCGGFIVTDIVPLLRGNDRPVLYIGDHEVGGPGDQIEANTREYIERHAGRQVWWKRIALTQAQVDADPRLLDLVIEKEDRRCKPARKYLAVECEAVGQATLVNILRAELDAMLPEPLERVRVREEEQRNRVAEILRKIAEE